MYVEPFVWLRLKALNKLLASVSSLPSSLFASVSMSASLLASASALVSASALASASASSSLASSSLLFVVVDVVVVVPLDLRDLR